LNQGLSRSPSRLHSARSASTSRSLLQRRREDGVSTGAYESSAHMIYFVEGRGRGGGVDSQTPAGQLQQPQQQKRHGGQRRWHRCDGQSHRSRASAAYDWKSLTSTEQAEDRRWRSASTCAAVSVLNILADKNRRDIGQAQSVWTESRRWRSDSTWAVACRRAASAASTGAMLMSCSGHYPRPWRLNIS
jgi:hypothetical protein